MAPTDIAVACYWRHRVGVTPTRWRHRHADTGVRRAGAQISRISPIGDLGGARDHWKQSLAIYLAAGAAEADEISDALVRLERTS